MATNLNPETVKSEASTIEKVWTPNPDFKLKDTTLDDFKAKKAALEAALDELEQRDLELTPLRNNRDQLALELNSLCVRARAGIKGYFGDNSSEYEQAGGTRTVERKKPTRKSKTVTA